MRTAPLLAIAVLVGAAGPAPAPLSDRDFQQLMNAAVAAASDPSQLQPLTKTICVARELRPPLEATEDRIKMFENKGHGDYWPRTGDVGADHSVAEAMSSEAVV